MGRNALTLLLIMTMLFGQSLCCCTLGTWCSALNGQPAADSCCCQTTDDSSGGCPDSSKGPGHECPCKKGKVAAANLASDVTVSSVLREGWARQFEIVADLGRPSFVGVAQLPATYFRSTAFPHLDRAGILRAVNSLRC